MNRTVVLAVFLTSLISVPAYAESKPFIETRIINPDLANLAAMSAASKCAESGYQVAVAIVDRSGTLQSFMRHPLAGSHTVDVSINKAMTAASFKTATKEMMLNPRLKQLNSVEGVLMIGGGIPILIGGHFYGGIGVSGAPGEKMSGDNDHACAEAGIESISEAIEFSD